MTLKWIILLSLVVVLVSSESDKVDTTLEIDNKTSDDTFYNDTSARQTNNDYGLYSSTFNFPSDDNDLPHQHLNTGTPGDQKKKRRRRRKPKRQNLIQGSDQYGQYYPQGSYYNQIPPFYGQHSLNKQYNFQKRPGNGQIGPNGQVQFQNTPGFANQYNSQYMPGFGQIQRPNPRPVRQGTLSSISGALASIAKYDDFQCVPRTLCEMASGRSPIASQGSLLSNLLNLEPLFTLLTAYNGASFSPIFSFGRAALLGMTSQGNSASCRYAYPRCPQDPDKLVDYLNNHNGGFFRFFNGGQNQEPNQQYGLSQFYDNLAGIQNNNNVQYQGSNHGQYDFPNGQNQGGSRFNSNRITFAHRNKAIDSETQNLDETRNPEQIEARIQNNPLSEIANDYNKALNYASNIESWQWLFPGQSKITTINNGDIGHQKNDKSFKFPTSNDNYNSYPGTRTSFTEDDNRKYRKPKTLSFPNEEKKYDVLNDYQRPLSAYDYSMEIFPIRTGTGNLKFDHYENSNPGTISPVSYTRPYKYNLAYANQGTKTQHYENDLVYIVRGNGDPNNPEIVRLTSNQNIY